MYTETLKEVLMPFNTKELENFNEATKSCTDEQKIAVAKRMRQETLPEGWQFTESQIKKFVEQDSYSKINWFPTIKINEGSEITSHTDSKLKDLKERQYNAYRASGLSEAEARSAAGL